MKTRIIPVSVLLGLLSLTATLFFSSCSFMPNDQEQFATLKFNLNAVSRSGGSYHAYIASIPNVSEDEMFLYSLVGAGPSFADTTPGIPVNMTVPLYQDNLFFVHLDGNDSRSEFDPITTSPLPMDDSFSDIQYLTSEYIYQDGQQIDLNIRDTTLSSIVSVVTNNISFSFNSNNNYGITSYYASVAFTNNSSNSDFAESYGNVDLFSGQSDPINISATDIQGSYGYDLQVMLMFVDGSMQIYQVDRRPGT